MHQRDSGVTETTESHPRSPSYQGSNVSYTLRSSPTPGTNHSPIGNVEFSAFDRTMSRRNASAEDKHYLVPEISLPVLGTAHLFFQPNE